MLIYTLCFHTRCALRIFCSVQPLIQSAPRAAHPNMATALELTLYLKDIMQTQTRQQE